MSMINKGNCFKILQKRNNSLYSYFLRYSGSYIEYSVTEVNLPKIGKLFVFDTYKNAKEEAGYREGLEIWECYAEDLEILPLNYIIPIGPPIEEVINFWKSGRTEPGYQMYIPKGTCFCSSLRLIRRIDGF